MPVDRGTVLQLCVLVLAVPLQYFITQYYSTNEAERSQSLKKIFNGALGFKDQYLTWRTWERWCSKIVSNLKTFTSDDRGGTAHDSDLQGESPAIEVMKYRDPKGHFAGSPEPRTSRPPQLKYRIGQVVKHKKWGYRGVIIGWDPEARAPEHWLEANHPPDKPHWRTQPNYGILVDTRDRMVPQLTYVPQDNLEVLTNVQIIHPSLDNYFESFDGAQYIARPSLKEIYPQD